MNENKQTDQKKVWSAPVVTEYGSVEDLTLQKRKPAKLKQIGSIDDFGNTGVSDA